MDFCRQFYALSFGPWCSEKTQDHLEEQQPNTEQEEKEHIRQATGESIQFIQRAIEQLLRQKDVSSTGDGGACPSTNQAAKGTPVFNTAFKNEEIIVIFIR